MSILPSDKEPTFWQQNLTALLGYYKATSDGLTSGEAAERLTRYGPNLFHPQRRNAFLFQFLSKFSNPLVIILLVASAISALTGDVASFIIISLIVLMSVTLDFIQEYRAGKEAEKLRQSVTVHVQALRDGKSQEIPLPSLVPGDVVLLTAGDLVPGDGRILEAKDFFVNQALLMDNVDEEYVMRPRQWDINFVRKFMLIIGPISSIFDFLTFFVMIKVFQAGEALFHTGWFIESLATQVLVIFVIRTHKNPLKSRPNPWLAICSLLVVALAVLLPFTPLGRIFGFVAPPLLFFFILASMVILYLLMVEVVKQWFYKHYASR
jgi:magnesium-transporting ATPase (P-type)